MRHFLDQIKQAAVSLSEAFQGIGLGLSYLWFRLEINPGLFLGESIHSFFAITTALLIAGLSPIAIHLSRSIFIPWMNKKLGIKSSTTIKDDEIKIEP